MTSKVSSGNIIAKSALNIAQSSHTLTAVSSEDMTIIRQLKSHRLCLDRSSIRLT